MIDNIQAVHEKLYKKLLDFTWSYCGDMNVAKDAVGKAFLMMLENKVPSDDLHAWLFANAKYEAYHDCYQVSKFAPVVLAENKPDSLDFRPVEEDVIERELREEQRLLGLKILSLVEKLSPRRRRVFNLRIIENQDISETAKNIGVARGTVQSTLFNAISSMRNDLSIDVQEKRKKCMYGACKRERVYRSSFCENHTSIVLNARNRSYRRRKKGWS